MQQPQAQEFEALFQRLYPSLLHYIRGTGSPAASASASGVPVVRYEKPTVLREKLNIHLPEHGSRSAEHIAKTVQGVLDYSVRSLHPRYWDKLYVGTDAIGQVAVSPS